MLNPDEVCIFEGSFRASAAFQGNTVLPIPLASSNGCSDVTQNFQYLVKMNIMDDGNLDFSFSDDSGFTYYTDQPKESCEVVYTAQEGVSHFAGGDGARRLKEL